MSIAEWLVTYVFAMWVVPCTLLSICLPNHTVRPIFAWYDIWIGIFIDRPKHRIYIFPIPMIGILIERNPHDTAG